MKLLICIVLVVLILPLLIVPIHAAENIYYIRGGATGANDGSDWTNAWTDLPASLERGATYYVAAGRYGPHLFNDEEVGAQVITIKKATVEDHGTDNGWNNSFANGQALFTASEGPIFRFTRGYYTFDGQTGEGNSGHGIKIYNPSNGAGHSTGSTLNAQNVSRYLTFKHIEIEGCNWKEDDTPSTRLLYFTGDNSYLTIRNCYIHETSTQWLYMNNSTDILIERSYFENCSRGMGLKIFGKSEQMNVIIRYNHFQNVYNANNFIQLGEHYCQKSSGYEIYGNVFYMNDPLARCSLAIGNCSDSANDNVLIYNNTFIGLRGSGLSFDNENDTIVATNNLWVDCSNPRFTNIKDENNSKNIYKSNILVNPEAGDFRLVIPIESGTDLGDTYRTDPEGKIRGEDGVWDMGAYEYQTVDHPVAFIDYSTVPGGLSGYEPFKVKFDGSASMVPEGRSIVSYLWDFGDGTTASGVTSEHLFLAGQHTVTLTVTDDLDREDTRSHVVRVQSTVNHNLYLYLPLNGNYSDASGKGMQTSWKEAPLYEEGVIGQAARFNQDTSRSIDVAHSDYLDGLENMTIAFWAKKNEAGSSARVIWKHGVYTFILTENGMKATLGGASVEAKNVVNDTEWHHYAVVYGDSYVIAYVDGVECSRVECNGSIKRDASHSIIIGRDPWGASLDGLMDEVRIYDKALSEAEVLALSSPSLNELTVETNASGQIFLAWQIPSSNTDIAGYRIYRNNIEVGSTSECNFAIESFFPGTESSYMVYACDWKGNKIGVSELVRYTAPLGFNIYPSGRNHSANACTGTVYVFGVDNSEWTLQTSEPWISVTGSGNGNGKFEYSVSPNTGITKREGEVVLKWNGGSQEVHYTIIQHPRKRLSSLGFYDPEGKQFILWSELEEGTEEAVLWSSIGVGWIPIVGDWNGDGSCTVGLYNPLEGRFCLDNDNSFEGNSADISFEFGPQSTEYVPVVGDWDGDGKDTVGLYYAITGTFILTDTNEAGATAKQIFNFGPMNSKLKPVVGDWDGDGVDTVGLYDAEVGVFYLKRSFVTVHDELIVAFGPVGGNGVPVAGDWNGDQVDTIGLYDPTTRMFYLRNSNSPGDVDLTVELGAPERDWIPVSGEFIEE